MPSSVLFLCSGNYYRSRFAEIYFNAGAAGSGLNWVAVSRGFRLSPNNVGPLSPHALEALRSLGLERGADARYPQTVVEDDFAAASLVICLKEAEHRPMMQERFPHRLAEVEFWRIDDIDCASPADALPRLAAELDRLAARLAQQGNAAEARVRP